MLCTPSTTRWLVLPECLILSLSSREVEDSIYSILAGLHILLCQDGPEDIKHDRHGGLKIRT